MEVVDSFNLLNNQVFPLGQIYTKFGMYFFLIKAKLTAFKIYVLGRVLFQHLYHYIVMGRIQNYHHEAL